jgi:hypothetical protein
MSHNTFFAEIDTLQKNYSVPVQDTGLNPQHIFNRIFCGVPSSAKNCLRHANYRKGAVFQLQHS